MKPYSLFGLLLLLLLALQSQAQSLTFEQSKAIFGQQKILKFRRFSLELDDESKAEVERLVVLINTYPDIMKRSLLIIQVFSCEKELKVKPYIGAVRGQIIIDILEKRVDMPRKKCLIQDNGKSPYDAECLAGSGANLYLRPDWRGRD